jgi:hypothetical protein
MLPCGGAARPFSRPIATLRRGRRGKNTAQAIVRRYSIARDILALGLLEPCWVCALCLCVRVISYNAVLGKLVPLRSSPMNDVLLGWPNAVGGAYPYRDLSSIDQ